MPRNITAKIQRFLKFSIWLIYFCLSSHYAAFSQVWIRTISDNNNSVFIRQLYESYDNGYLVGGDLTIGFTGLYKIGWILKLDINGNLLWERKFGNGNRIWEIEGISQSQDGGTIITGGADSLDIGWSDPWVAKLNSCGEIDWCHIFRSDSMWYCGRRIISLQDGSFIMLVYSHEPSTLLFHLDSNGNILWEQKYFINDTLVQGEDPRFLTITQSGMFLISGICYYPDSNSSSPLWLRPMIVLADSLGQAIWELPWGYANNFSGEGYESFMLGQDGPIVTSTSNYLRVPLGKYRPSLNYTLADGTPTYYKDLKTNTDFGKASTIANMDDTSFFVGAGYQIGNINFCSIFKTDSLGNVIQEKVLSNTGFMPVFSILTHDKKRVFHKLCQSQHLKTNANFDKYGEKTI